LLLFLAIPAFPWGDDGHQMVARIAARNLTPAARKGIVALMRSGAPDGLNLRALIGAPGDPQPPDDAVEEAMARIAIWPDHMPGGKGATSPWHFVDIGLFEGPSHLAERCGAGSCITEKIAELVKLLPTGAPMGNFRSDRQLRFLVHFMGDIHQPLHCVTNADAGGNCEKVSGFGGSTKLHSAWDTALVRLMLENTDDAEASIITEFASTLSAEQQVTDPAKIAAESFELARTAVIRSFVEVTPSKCSTQAPASIRRAKVKGPESYDNDETLKLIRQQLFRGGVRLAAILNQLFT
jgi:hypothetical protein